jgi:hypothetical protein
LGSLYQFKFPLRFPSRRPLNGSAVPSTCIQFYSIGYLINTLVRGRPKTVNTFSFLSAIVYHITGEMKRQGCRTGTPRKRTFPSTPHCCLRQRNDMIRAEKPECSNQRMKRLSIYLALQITTKTVRLSVRCWLAPGRL